MRREDLQSSLSTPRSSPDPELVDLFRNTQNDDFALVEKSWQASHDPETQEEKENDMVSFRLFASAPTRTKEQIIRIRSPSIETQKPGLIQPHRPQSYYFTGNDSHQLNAQFAIAAVDGNDIIARSKQACPGSRMPWRVAVIDPAQDQTGKSATMKTTSTPGSEPAKKTKPGKKHRIALRTKKAASKAAAADKEIAEREKRTKRNREKKVKKREKEKAKKSVLEPT